jgi:methylated-DNA-protein-cysteine methyltransferase-like protein
MIREPRRRETAGRQDGVFARLLAVVRRIPRGRVASYGQVARLAGLPRHARHVGYALHALPEGTPLPWHRVVNARGGISLRPWSSEGGGAETQRLRLAAEGIRFDGRDRVPMERYGWRPPGARNAVARTRAASSRARPPRPPRRLDPSRRVG